MKRIENENIVKSKLINEDKLDTSGLYFHGSMSPRKTELERPSYRHPFYITKDLDYAMAFASKNYSSTGGKRDLRFGETGYVYLITVNPNAEFFDFRKKESHGALESILTKPLFTAVMTHCRQIMGYPENAEITDIWEFGQALASLVYAVKNGEYGDQIWTMYSAKTTDRLKDMLLPMTDYVEEGESHEILAYLFEKLDKHPNGYKGVITTENDLDPALDYAQVSTDYAVGIWNIDGFGLMNGGAMKYGFCRKMRNAESGTAEQRIRKYVSTYNRIFGKQKVDEAEPVGNGKEHPSAILTRPRESPNTFDGVPLDQIKSPTGKKIKYKFFTEKGSEYILSETNESRRIKCNVHGAAEAGLHPWKSFTFFAKTPDIIEEELDSVIRYAFGRKDVVKPDMPTCIGFKIQGGKMYLHRYSFADGKWHVVTSVNDMMQMRLAEMRGKQLPQTAQKPILENVTLTPTVGYAVVELKTKNNCIIGYHPGHDVSFVEKTDTPEKTKDVSRMTVAEVCRLCQDASSKPLSRIYIWFDENGRKIPVGKTAKDVFDDLTSRHGPDYQFAKCFGLHGKPLKKISMSGQNALNQITFEVEV